MRIIFEEKDCGYKFIFDTDWTFGKKLLEMCWEEMTFANFKRITDRNNEEMLKDYEKTSKVKKRKGEGSYSGG